MKTKRLIIKLIVVIGATSLLTACPGSKEKGSNVRTGNGIHGTGSCSGCSETNYLYSAIGRSGTGIELVADFYRVTDVDANLVSNDGYYNGQVTAEGALYVNGGTGYGYCNIPIDAYSLEVIGYGSIDANGTMTGIRVRGYGSRTGYEIYLTQRSNAFLALQQGAQIGCDGHEYTMEVLGQWQIDAITGNANNCHGSTFNLYDARSARSCPN